MIKRQVNKIMKTHFEYYKGIMIYNINSMDFVNDVYYQYYKYYDVKESNWR